MAELSWALGNSDHVYPRVSVERPSMDHEDYDRYLRQLATFTAPSFNALSPPDEQYTLYKLLYNTPKLTLNLDVDIHLLLRNR